MNPYKDKITKALSYIEKNLSSDLSLKTISRECAISEFHFHRIFSSNMNETLRNYIIRRRLEYALSRIAYGNRDINLLNLALDVGYSSQANFNKAFKAYYGVTPSQVKEGESPKNSKEGKLKSKYGKDFKIENLYPKAELNSGQSKEEDIMKAEIKVFPAREVIFKRSEGGYEKQSIYKVWNELITSLVAVGNDPEEALKYGIGRDNPQVTPEEKCRYEACVDTSSLKEVPAQFERMELPEGKYACFYFCGNGEELLEMYLNIYKNWFSENGHEPGDFPLIEQYINVDKDNPDADIELETQFLLV